MAFRVIFIFRRIGADRIGYKCHIKKIAGYAHIGAIGMANVIISAIARQGNA